jgi:transcriptional regulator with XRE-family HTH domain
MTTRTPTNFGPRLRAIRTKAGLTRAELAERAAITRQQVYKLEDGTNEPAWGNVLAIARALGVTPDAFL